MFAFLFSSSFCRSFISFLSLIQVEFYLSADVANVDFTAAEVTLRGGMKAHGDLILADDGLWSQARSLFHGRQINPQPTGDLAYHVMLHAQNVTDPELKEWISKPRVTFGIGPYCHGVGYLVRHGRFSNIDCSAKAR